jgi:glyceraldehyde-3-phosphate dehydrogenase/erythrose-4-phosphate dehydrogenase
MLNQTKHITSVAILIIIPSVDVSVVDLTCELDKPASYEEICATIKATSEGAMTCSSYMNKYQTLYSVC